jgi:hypothetical protein
MSSGVADAFNLGKDKMREWLRTCSPEQLDEFIDNCSAAGNAWSTRLPNATVVLLNGWPVRIHLSGGAYGSPSRA